MPRRSKKNKKYSEELKIEYVKNCYEESNGIFGYRKMCININREKINELQKLRITYSFTILAGTGNALTV